MYIRDKALRLEDGKTLTRLEIGEDSKLIINHLKEIQDNCKKVVKQLQKSYKIS